jgi:hypothetical protein
MQQVEIDGVPVVWEQGPAPLRATLTFGVGARDETFRTIGVAHMVEHLAMGALPRVHYDRNASVDAVTTDFTVCGRPEQVVEFLDQVCRALGDLPLDRMAKEAGVLAAEGGHVAAPAVEALLHERLGARGAGLAVYTGPGYDRLTREHVRAFAERYFVAGNAVLQLTGPPPEGLRLPLPPGPRPARELPSPAPQSGPTWTNAGTPSVAAAMVADWDVAWTVGMGILIDRLEQIARHEHGLSYDVDGATVSLGGDTVLTAVAVDAREGQEGRVAELLWQELRRMAAEGPADADVAHEIQGAREAFADPRFVEVDLQRAAEALLFGETFQPRAQRLAAIETVTAEQIRDRLAAALPSVQIVLPCDVAADLPGMTEGGCPRGRVEPPGRVFTPPLLAKAMNRGARGLRLILTGDGLALREPDGDVHTVRWAEVVGVQRHEGERIVFGASSCLVAVDPELFRGAEAAVAAVDSHVPASLHWELSEFVPAD